MIKIPNWCENSLTVTIAKPKTKIQYLDGKIIKQEDKTHLLKEFKEFAKSDIRKNEDGEPSDIDFNNFVPYPKKFKDMDLKAQEWSKKAGEFAVKHGYENWYKLTDKLRDIFIRDNGEEPADGYNSGGYEWCCDNWSTKWNACEVSCDGSDKAIYYSFNTAWSPPINVIGAMSEKFPELRFTIKFWEMGAGFQGKCVFEKGKLIENIEKDYSGGRGG